MSKPVIFNTKEALLDYLKDDQVEVVDLYERQLKELYEISNPMNPTNLSGLSDFIESKKVDQTNGSWIYFPWNNTAIHMVNEEDFFTLRTNRNQNLITDKEQQILRSKTVGVVGMSVGAWIAIGCAYSGISDTVKIADFDEVDTTNMNRLTVSVADLYVNKAVLAARSIYEANPFAKVTAFDSKIEESNMDTFFNGDRKLDLVFDEVDDFKLKVQLRLKAKEERVPLVMMTSIDNKILVDVERYDLDQKITPFLGKADEAVEQISSSVEITPEDTKKYAITLAGKENVSRRALGSVMEIGKTLSGRPQLFSTVNVSDGLAVHLSRKILLGDESNTISSGRYKLNLDEIFENDG